MREKGEGRGGERRRKEGRKEEGELQCSYIAKK